MLAKRSLEDAESAPEAGAPSPKRLESAADEFLQILEDDEEVSASEEDVEGVMKTLEQEIGSVSASSVVETENEVEKKSLSLGDGAELGFLLEASDAELGIGPVSLNGVSSNEEVFQAISVPTSVSLSEDEFRIQGSGSFAGNQSVKSIAENWNLEDEFWNYNDQISAFGDAAWEFGGVGGQNLPFDGDLSASVGLRMETAAGL
eukprot:TRINITY_DN11427_c0_g1_i1.p1 TRINITY_DN11427_c0_g1~~TRINITY_DN11427_c0_g1_i1.p1  ORF type:complete len:204 (+),score=37.44 TRINITY_DN11427_c0_g1_i1:769-1380(+)